MSDPTPVDDGAARERIAELVRDFRVGVLTTIDGEGRPWSRPMALQSRDFDGDLWFFTGADTPKVAHIAAHPDVSVALVNVETQTYVTLAGRASVLDDRATMRDLWDLAAKVYYPDGPDDPTLRLVRVAVERAEYWDSPSNPFVLAYGAARSLLTGTPPTDLGDHGTAEIG